MCVDIVENDRHLRLCLHQMKIRIGCPNINKQCFVRSKPCIKYGMVVGRPVAQLGNWFVYAQTDELGHGATNGTIIAIGQYI